MTDSVSDKYAASEQGLGYIYQPRLALLRLLDLPEATAVLLEKDDDLDFVDKDGIKSLASLKHKAAGDRLTDLSIDFWKSIRIWLARYKRDGGSACNLRFFLLTTSKVSDTSFLRGFLPDWSSSGNEGKTLLEQAEEALNKSKAVSIQSIANEFNELTLTEKQDFLDRILILDSSPRIEDIPEIIKEKHLRVIRREHRNAVFERLEGWWNDEVIKQLTCSRDEEIFGFEVSDKLYAISEEYRSDNLPITFRGIKPEGEIDTEEDPRNFVVQLREIGVSSNRIRNAILDYYRAFEQRSEWARENLMLEGEIEDYEDRLVDEWSRYRDVVFEGLDETAAEEILQQAGKELYNWADMQSGNIESLRIRARVTEPYVTRGSFHILADGTPEPRVYWHPCFLDRLNMALEVSK
ncbi:ABC-three component system protein [Franzmannia qiaohouensis]|uniref:ABC-three component systems C-terminal domain-containing protein n=1 Tax=Franzmannia qiaohouensis TaxID=1329370 RepID=A0ABU1HDW4_9GAMM|nr:ABC-three component system protein [Halomonas qiaohouensis]MDR5905665.1 hypothetical protein [Halomonas qiaohouensis]